MLQNRKTQVTVTIDSHSLAASKSGLGVSDAVVLGSGTDNEYLAFSTRPDHVQELYRLPVELSNAPALRVPSATVQRPVYRTS